jgi:hypothetical protein
MTTTGGIVRGEQVQSLSAPAFRITRWPTGRQWEMRVWKLHLTILKVVTKHNLNRASLSIWMDWR